MLVSNLQILQNEHAEDLKRWLILRDLITQPALKDKHYEICKKDPIHFINTCITSYNPRIKPSLHPLILFPQQVKYVRWLQSLESDKEWGCLLKSRYTGASVVTCAYYIWRFIFDGSFKGGLGSNLERNVHTLGNIDSLFGKIEDMLDRLPTHIKPRYSVKRNLIVNLDNGAKLTGDSGKNIGRGGRSTLFVVDEAAHVEHDQAAISALSENTDVCVLLSTPKGIGNQFAIAWESEGFSKFKIHWSDDPRRSQEWYEKQKTKFDAHIIAQELDCSFTGSNQNSVILYDWVLAAIANKKEIKHYDSQINICAGYDPAGSGIRDKHVLTIRSDNQVTLIESWTGLDAIASANKVIDLCLANKVKYLNYDSGGGYGETLTSVLQSRELSLNYQAINFGASPTDYVWDDDISSKDKFLNLRIEMYWQLRERFRKTYEYLTFSQEYDEDELIYIPDHADLKIQLTQPEIEFVAGRKLKLMSKSDMRSKGIKSPDFADSLALCFFESNDLGCWWR